MKYTKPITEVIEIESSDVIATSAGGGDNPNVPKTETFSPFSTTWYNVGSILGDI